MRESAGQGAVERRIATQKPLAIYVPPEKLQLWQTGRSRSKINKITRRHPGIDLDILRQYKLIYQWIEGLDIVQAFEQIGLRGQELDQRLRPIVLRVIRDMEAHGYVVADMKAAHIIIGEEHIDAVNRIDGANRREAQSRFLHEVIDAGSYSVIDYELLLRTPAHEAQVKQTRRHTYLDDQRNRYAATPLPEHLRASDIMGVPYVHGHVESTGGALWVVGRNPRLFDYFLPERWRKTPSRALSERHEVFYTLTKDNVHVVWKTSRVGEFPADEDFPDRLRLIRERGYNSPFEEFAIAATLNELGIPCVYVRAIYMTGSAKLEGVADPRRFATHRDLRALDGQPILRENRNYISVRGYYNGPDSWVATQEGPLYEPVDLQRAVARTILSHEEARELLAGVQARLGEVGYDGSLLELNDVLLAIRPGGDVARDTHGRPEARICNFELLYRR